MPRVLEALSVYRPRAVFVDFAFVDKRSGQDVARLNEAICGLQKSGTAAYLAAPPPPAGAASPLPAAKTNGHGLRDDLRWDCFEVVTAKMDAADGASGVLTYSNGHYASPSPELARPPVRVDACLRHVRAERDGGAARSR